MIDGGGATKFNTLPIHGDHYVYDPSDTRYPDLAFQPNTEGGGRGRWEWDMKRPRFIGEDFFATGVNPADYAQWGGESSFLSKTAARPGADWAFRNLTEGYRWVGQSAWHFWLGKNEVVNPWNSNSWRAVFVRQYDQAFGSGQKVNRTFGIFNDTQYPEPLTFTRVLRVGNKDAYRKTSTHKVDPGSSYKFDEVIPMPTVASRQEGQLVLTLSAGGKEIFRDTKPVSVLAPVGVVTARPCCKARCKTCKACRQTGDASCRLVCRNAQFGPDTQPTGNNNCCGVRPKKIGDAIFKQPWHQIHGY
jgi:beta-galactosidase